MQSDQKKLKLEVCHHEAGHWVIAQEMGFEATDITITIHKDGELITTSGSATVFPRLEANSIEAIEEYLIKRIAVLFSGVISQAIVIENKDKDTACNLLKTNGLDDARSTNELLQILRGIRFPGKVTGDELSQINEIQTECWKKADALIEQNKERIQRVARGMASKIQSLNRPMKFSKSMLQEFSARERSN